MYMYVISLYVAIYEYIFTCNYISYTYVCTLYALILLVTGHEKIGLMYTQNLTTFLDFKLE